MVTRATRQALAGLGAISLLWASAAQAGNSTRIQIVAKIPPISLSVTDASGDIAGEVDGIATDSMAGASPGEILLGAQLHLKRKEGRVQRLDLSGRQVVHRRLHQRRRGTDGPVGETPGRHQSG